MNPFIIITAAFPQNKFIKAVETVNNLQKTSFSKQKRQEFTDKQKNPNI
jgi:hypothetical protein